LGGTGKHAAGRTTSIITGMNLFIMPSSVDSGVTIAEILQDI
jgi:hypothetical protein